MRPDMSSVPLDDEQKTTQSSSNVQGYVTRYEEQPATGIPAKPAWNPPPPQMPPQSSWNNDSMTVPIATFEQSAPYGGYPSQNQEPLPCKCGIQWTLFCIGWLLWPLWYAGVALKFFNKQKPFDNRERPGWLANVVMSVIFTVVWVSLLFMGAYTDYSTDPECIPDPVSGLCL